MITKASKKYLEDAKKRDPKALLYPKDLHFILKTDLKIVGITGTNGKTTVASAIYSILLDLGLNVGLQGTRGFFVNEKEIGKRSLTTPSLFETYCNIDIAKEMGCEYFIMEVSSHAIDQQRIEDLIFELKIHTNITSDHLDYHGSVEEYRRVKNSFFKDETKKLVNRDDKYIEPNLKNCFSYGVENSSTFKVNAYTLNSGIDAYCSYFQEQFYFHSHLFGLYNLYNILASISAIKLLLEDVKIEEIASCVENFGGVRGRCEVVNQSPLIIIDFAHTEDGMKKIFESFSKRDIVVLFGAGGDRDRSKRAPMGRVASRFAKRAYITSDNPRSENEMDIINDILEGFEGNNYKIVANRKEAIELAIKELQKEELLLILGKGDEEYQEINGVKHPFSDLDEAQISLGKINSF